MEFLLNQFTAVVTHGSSPYCTTPASSWLNIISNVAHIGAAYFAFRYLRANAVKTKVLFILVALLFLIGIGSTLWHAFPMPITDAADTIPLGLFAFLFTYTFFKKAVGSKAVALGALLLITMGLILLEPLHLLKGSFPYIVILAVLATVLFRLKQKYQRVPSSWAVAFTIFGVAIFFRTADFAACDVLGFGTHFIWHILIAAAVYFGIRFLVEVEHMNYENKD